MVYLHVLILNTCVPIIIKLYGLDLIGDIMQLLLTLNLNVPLNYLKFQMHVACFSLCPIRHTITILIDYSLLNRNFGPVDRYVSQVVLYYIINNFVVNPQQ